MFVIVPVKDQLEHTRGIIDQLTAQGGYEAVFVYDNGSRRQTAELLARRDGHYGVEVIDAAGWPLYEMWQRGVERARERAEACDIAVLNNDLRLGPDFLRSLGATLRSEPALWAVSPRYDDRPISGTEYVSGTFKDGGLAGFAFVTRGEAFDQLAFDAGFNVWFGDDDLVAQIEQAGHKVALTSATWVEHIDGGGHTLRQRPDLCEELRADKERMIAKWHHS